MTSGSTGSPVLGYWDKKTAHLKRAAIVRSNRWAGWDIGERIACLYGVSSRGIKSLSDLRRAVRRRLLDRLDILDMLSMSEASMEEFLAQSRRKPPSLIWGHAHGLYLLAMYVLQSGYTTTARGMISAGMMLSERERRSSAHSTVACWIDTAAKNSRSLHRSAVSKADSISTRTSSTSSSSIVTAIRSRPGNQARP